MGARSTASPGGPMKFTLALAQIDSVIGDVRKNIARHLDFIRRAREGGADLVVFPELSLSGYSVKDTNWDAARRADDPLLAPIAAAGREIAVLCGAVEEAAGYGIFNSALFFEGGTVRTVHRKVYLPTYGMFEEQRYFSPGTSVRAFDSPLGRLGALICEDLWHLPLPYLLARDGAELVAGIASSPTRLGGEDAMLVARTNLEQHTSYARLLSTYVVFCNRVGFEDGVNFWGGSAVVAPSGDVVVRAKFFDEDLIFAEIDSNEVRRARRLSRHFLDDDPRLVQSELGRILGR